MSGKMIGRYEILRELGRGGMATVYLGHDPKLERQVAIKVLPSQFANDPEFFDRFQQEAKTLATLQHNAIVGLIDSGEDEGFPYFIMQLMSGGSLKDRITNDPPDTDEMLTILGRIASALDKAHGSGIIHRDIKPSNILFDEDGEAYLSDFGIVKLTQAEEGLTRTSGAIGTPHYMSPEQLDGVADLDGRADIYALAVVLYKTLVGDPPYHHQSSTRIMVMHLNDPIPNILEKRPDLPPAVQAIIEKGMAKDRDDRYRKASELVADLRSALAGWDPTAAVTNEKAASAEPTQATTVEPSKPSPPPAKTQVAPLVSDSKPPSNNKNIGLYTLAGVGGVAVLVLAVLGILSLLNNDSEDEAQAAATAVPTQIAVVEPTKKPTEKPTATATATEKPTATLAPVTIITRPPTATPPPTNTAEPTPTATETPLPTATPTTAITLNDVKTALAKEENILQFAGLFKGRELTDITKNENIQFEDEQLILQSDEKSATIAYLPFEESPDGYYETEISFLDGDMKHGWAGLILRVEKNGKRFYVFEINGNGQVRGARIGTSGDIVYIPASQLYNTAGQKINTGIGAKNRLGIKINKNTLEFFINGSNRGGFVFKDTFLVSGGIGLSSRVDKRGAAIKTSFSYLGTRAK